MELTASDTAEEEGISDVAIEHTQYSMQKKARKKASLFYRTSSNLIHMPFEPLQEKSLVHESSLLLKFQINLNSSMGSNCNHNKNPKQPFSFFFFSRNGKDDSKVFIKMHRT